MYWRNLGRRSRHWAGWGCYRSFSIRFSGLVMLGTEKVRRLQRLVDEHRDVGGHRTAGKVARRGWVWGYEWWAAACVLVVGVLMAVGCESDARSGEVQSERDVEAGGECREFEERLVELRDERDSLETKREAVRRRLEDLEEAVEQLDAFEPELKATTVHIYPKPGAEPREVGGQIRNGTDKTVAVMHLAATLVPPGEENGGPMERDVAYELREPLESGEVQHAPYGKQLVDAFPDVGSEAWIEGELELEVMVLEGPDGEMLWDRRGRDVDTIERRIEKIEGEIDSIDESMSSLEARLSERRSSGSCGE